MAENEKNWAKNRENEDKLSIFEVRKWFLLKF